MIAFGVCLAVLLDFPVRGVVVDQGVAVAVAEEDVDVDVDVIVTVVVVAATAAAAAVVERNLLRSLQMSLTRNWITTMPRQCKHPEVLGCETCC